MFSLACFGTTFVLCLDQSATGKMTALIVKQSHGLGQQVTLTSYLLVKIKCVFANVPIFVCIVCSLNSLHMNRHCMIVHGIDVVSEP